MLEQVAILAGLDLGDTGPIRARPASYSSADPLRIARGKAIGFDAKQVRFNSFQRHARYRPNLVEASRPGGGALAGLGEDVNLVLMKIDPGPVAHEVGARSQTVGATIKQAMQRQATPEPERVKKPWYKSPVVWVLGAGALFAFAMAAKSGGLLGDAGSGGRRAKAMRKRRGVR